jgi:acetylserotonin O-methyltransferase
MSRIPSPTLSDAAPVLELIDAFRRSKAMFVGVSLRLFDRLAEEPATAARLAAELQVNGEALERLLDTLASMFLLRKDNGLYRNTATADTFLVATSPHSMRGYIIYSNDILFPMWNHLEDAVREGSHRWPQTFQLDGPLFSSFFQTDDSMRVFLLGMHGFGMMSSPAVAQAFDLSRFRHACDLGGATGHLVSALLDAYPGMKGTLFELPRVLDFARQRAEHDTRLTYAPGDFFADALPPADLYVLGRILHDWSPQRITLLLARIRQALPPGGALLIAEKLLVEDRTGPTAANLQSLNMLVCTEGKERSLSDYTKLLQAAGFLQVEGKRTGAPVDAILATR